MSLTEEQLLIRPLVRRLAPYVPGEQPKVKGLIKLNTNENPYPPSPKVLEALKDAIDARLRLYPSPTADPLREKLAAYHGCKPENIIVGNGMDELLAMAVRAFVEPNTGWMPVRNASKSVVQYFHPSYSLYPVLAEIHGAVRNPVPLDPDFGIPTLAELKKGRVWDSRAALTFLTTPNAPSGRAYSREQLEEMCSIHKGVLLMDEAYVDFAESNAMDLALKHSNVIVGRTFSKAYSLCFQRVGYFVGHPELIEALQKIRDSYNVNGLGQIAAAATLDDLKYYRRNIKEVVETRSAMDGALKELGFHVLPSQANFILVRPPTLTAEAWYDKLRQQNILVRWFNHSDIGDRLRISIGSPKETEALLGAVRKLLRK
jgi:histidinol-phosphate aminotransferase